MKLCNNKKPDVTLAFDLDRKDAGMVAGNSSFYINTENPGLFSFS